MKKRDFSFKRSRSGIKRKSRNKKILIVIAVVLLCATIYFTFFFSRKCTNRDCFDISLAKCERATYTNYAPDATWIYQIKGKELRKDICDVYVKSIDMKNLENAQKLKGKDMICYLPYKVVMSPESNLDYCHGLLKEGMQDIIITKMHLYIIQNIGEIKESIEKI